MTDADPLAPHGWRSSFPEFEKAPARVVRARLQDFIPDASPQQVRAWDDSIPKLQTEVREVIEGESDAGRYTAILEYELPLDARRPDVILLVRGAIVALELKGKSLAAQADIDQAAAYARNLRGYHRSCAGREVHRRTREVPRESEYMVYSTYHWRPIVNGYGRHEPPGTHPVVGAVTAFPGPNSAIRMRRLGIRFIVLHTGRFPDGAADVLAEARTSRDFELVAAEGGDYLFRVRTAPGQ